MDDNEKRLEILRRTKKRRKQVDITFILAALAVLHWPVLYGQALPGCWPCAVAGADWFEFTGLAWAQCSGGSGQRLLALNPQRSRLTLHACTTRRVCAPPRRIITPAAVLTQRPRGRWT